MVVAVKKEAQDMIQNLPDNCTYEDIQYHLYVVEKIKNGMSRAEDGEVVSHQDAKERMAKWLSN
jgi:predicted transcriptional regulator